MSEAQYTYEFDPNGTNPANRVVGENHTITPANGADFNFIVPRAAPYHRNSLVVRHPASGTTLTEGIDYVPSWYFEAGSNTAPYPAIYAAISLLTTQFEGSTLQLEYQTLGGEFVLDEVILTTILANVQLDPRTTTWDSVSMKPGIYLPEPHLHHILETVGYDELVEVLREFKDGFTLEFSSLMTAIQSHITDKNNPHDTDLVKLGIARFENVYRSTFEEMLEGTNDINYITAKVVRDLLEHLDLYNVGSYADIMSGDEGDLPFFTGSPERFSIDKGVVLRPLGIVHTAAELTAQLDARESFLDVFNSWRRIAMRFNNPINDPNELSGWVYDSNADLIRSTINSSSVVGFVSPEKVPGDFVFEVTLGSTNSDDDRIGLVLGPVLHEGVWRNLFIYRSIEGPRLLNVTLDYGSGAETWHVAQTNTDLMWPDGVINNSRVNNSDGPGNFYGGWNAYHALGEIPLKIERIGNQLIVDTGNPGQIDYVPGARLVIDLTSDPRLEVFSGSINIGYAQQSQNASYWRTLRRTGANPTIAALHTGAIYTWDGEQYLIDANRTLLDTVRRGRFYENRFFGRTYFAPSSGSAVRIGGSGMNKDVTSSSAVLDRVTYVNNDSQMAVGEYVDFWSQHPTNGTMTYRGRIAKPAVGVTHSLSGNTGNHIHYLGNTQGVLAGTRAETDGTVGFVNGSGGWLAYIDTNGVWQHNGLNRLSDQRLKEIVGIIDPDDIDLDLIDLYRWVWKETEEVPEQFRGKEDSGVLAQEVQKVFPGCVSVNSETGFLTVDDSKLALHVSLLVAKQLRKLVSKE